MTKKEIIIKQNCCNAKQASIKNVSIKCESVFFGDIGFLEHKTFQFIFNNLSLFSVLLDPSSFS